MTKELKSPPGLAGTTFSEKDKETARKNHKLLFISLMTDSVCNLACPDCYVGKKGLSGKELTLKERKDILDQAKKLGAKTLRIAGEGEPLLDKNFWPTITYATKKLGMHVFFFTNGTIIDKNIAKKLYENPNITTVLKFCGSPNIMEYLTGNMKKFGTKNFIKHDEIYIPKYVKNMIDIGMNKKNKYGNSRLGIEFLLRKSNYGFVFDIFRWARRNNIIPYVEQNLEAGYANTWNIYNQERVDDKDAFALSKRLLEIDEKEFGFTWKPSIPYLVGGICESELKGCKKFTYNIVISSTGEIHPCYATYFSLGNIRKKTLKEGLLHPIRQKLLMKPKYNCLCRVFSKSSTGHPVKTVNDLDSEFDYDYGSNKITDLERWLENPPKQIKEYLQAEEHWLVDNIKDNSSILDVGCGFGRHIKILHKKAKKIFGIDNNPDMIYKAKKLLAGNKKVELFLTDAKKMPFENKKFDYSILMLNTFGNLGNDKYKILKEMHRVTRKKIILSVWTEKAFDFRIEAYKRANIKVIKTEGHKIKLNNHSSIAFNKEELKHLIPYKYKINDLGIGYIIEIIC